MKTINVAKQYIINKPLEIQSGKTYVIQLERDCNASSFDKIKDIYAAAGDKLGVTFLVLHNGVTLLTSKGEV